MFFQYFVREFSWATFVWYFIFIDKSIHQPQQVDPVDISYICMQQKESQAKLNWFSAFLGTWLFSWLHFRSWQILSSICCSRESASRVFFIGIDKTLGMLKNFILFRLLYSSKSERETFWKAVSFKRLQPFGYVILLAWFSHRPQITFLGDTQFIEDIEFWKKIIVAFIKVDSFALLCLFFISVRSRMYLNIDSHFELSHSAKHRKKNYSQIERLSHSQLDETTMTTDYVPRIPNYSVSLFERKILVSSSLVFYCFVFVFEIQVIFGTGSFSFLAFSIN